MAPIIGIHYLLFTICGFKESESILILFHMQYILPSELLTCVAPRLPHAVDPAVTEELPADAVPAPGLTHVHPPPWGHEDQG